MTRNLINRRTVLAGLASSAVAGVLAGCGGNGGSGGGSGGEGETGKADLTFATWESYTANAIKKQLPAFQQKFPGIKLEVTLTPWKDYFTKLQTQASAGNAPDLFAMNGVQFDLYASEGMIDPIDELVSGGQLDLAKYPKSLVERYVWQDKQYGVPNNFDSVALFYNKSIFDNAGQQYPTDDWTWDQFLRTAAAISAKLKGQGIYGFTPAMGDSQITYYNSIPAAGGYVIDRKQNKSGYDRPETIEGLKFFGDVLNNGTSPTIQQLTDIPGTDWFINGKGAMTWAASYNLSDLSGSKLAKDFQIVRLPTKKTNQCVLNGTTTVISSRSKNKAAAREVLKWIAGPEFAAAVAEDGQVIPAYDGSQGAFLKTIPNWNLKTFIDAAADGYLYPTSKNTKAWDQLEAPTLAPLWQGKASADTVGKKLAAAMNDALAKE
ncbi:multiple sugar transport system substrate-binding protein [Kribbella aluminosa]|uniref:Multiple sugar transport system substrate-binding protein n=1 Tax=Kribbella aluminosa TaxID=416017 RepID=A0ABS4UWN3_9ACTN|nr:sugar ABC transporter substrate-binding protein [Kribbella aluminosa]MBP2356040.1 multiple sugar transport system substrate-binding protein [Kribbella aluminosa]